MIAPERSQLMHWVLSTAPREGVTYRSMCDGTASQQSHLSVGHDFPVAAQMNTPSH